MSITQIKKLIKCLESSNQPEGKMKEIYNYFHELSEYDKDELLNYLHTILES